MTEERSPAVARLRGFGLLAAGLAAVVLALLGTAAVSAFLYYNVCSYDGELRFGLFLGNDDCNLCSCDWSGVSCASSECTEAGRAEMRRKYR